MDNLFPTTLNKIIVSITAVVVIYALRTFVHSIIRKRTKSLRKKFVLRQSWNYIFLAIGFFFVFLVWGDRIANIFTLLSLVAAALIIVSKEIIINIFANGIIIWRGLFQIGDRISIGDISGDVIETGPLFISIAEIGNWVSGDEPTGRVIKVPNSIALTSPTANYSRGVDLIWNELSIVININSDINKAQEIALEVLVKNAHVFSEKDIEIISKQNEDILFLSKNPKVYVKGLDDKIQLTLRYPCKFYKRRETEHFIWEELLIRYREEGIITNFK